uniref:WAP domain-containing protein n=1 Tax=Equus asinus asinus TaxID=83772 RepID=A0A8C4N1B1_EQUAS
LNFQELSKHGVCPFVPPTICFVYEPPECQSDWQCPKKQKCCRALCGIKCVEPEDPSKPVKVNPGKCPVVTGRCKTPNPTDYCLNDGHCLFGDKCCKGVCGKSCVKPVKGKEKISLRSTSLHMPIQPQPPGAFPCEGGVLGISLRHPPPPRRSSAFNTVL